MEVMLSINYSVDQFQITSNFTQLALHRKNFFLLNQIYFSRLCYKISMIDLEIYNI